MHNQVSNKLPPINERAELYRKWVNSGFHRACSMAFEPSEHLRGKAARHRMGSRCVVAVKVIDSDHAFEYARTSDHSSVECLDRRRLDRRLADLEQNREYAGPIAGADADGIIFVACRGIGVELDRLIAEVTAQYILAAKHLHELHERERSRVAA